MISGSTRKIRKEELLSDVTTKRSPTEPIEHSSETPVLPKRSSDFSSVKLRNEFVAWLRQEAARRGVFLYELIEDITSRTIAGRTPWKSK